MNPATPMPTPMPTLLRRLRCAISRAVPARVSVLATMSVLAVVAIAGLPGCTLLPDAKPVISYDFGPATPSVSGAPGAASLPPLRVSQTDGPVWLDSNAIHYRLQYAQAERLQPYATQRWVMSPLRLFDERLRDAVAARGDLSWQGDTSAPALKIDILDFEQVFDRADASRGVVRVRATVYRNGMIGQKTFTAERPAPSADGAGGVTALAAASDGVVAAVLDWVATLPVR